MLQITNSQMATIRSHAQESYPQECCGILIGEESGEVRRVVSVNTCRNDETVSSANRYKIHPKDLIAAQKLARQQGFDIIGFYHSHPDHPPRWSGTDLKEAHWMGSSYLIVSVSAKGTSDAASYLLRGANEEEKHFEEEELHLL
ncbi:MAG TPA: M67 family metallopeptidase [Terriglobales bacterium]|nr:M67 family metallopeptidase [Terriglobales bacterium]